MNPAKLMLSAALASLMLFTPAVFTTADAAGIKIKPQIVKVRPKIKIAKPKVRVKVRAAKVRIKPKVKVKVRTTKIQIKPKVKVKVRAANVKMKPKVQLPAVQLTQRPKVVKPKTQISQTAKTALNGCCDSTVILAEQRKLSVLISLNGIASFAKPSRSWTQGISHWRTQYSRYGPVNTASWKGQLSDQTA